MVLSLGLISGAYLSEIFRGAMNSVNRDEILAAEAMGMTRMQSFLYIMLPQMFRFSIPGMINEFTSILMELEAARAEGFTPLEIFRLIILPQTLRRAVPSLTNQVIQNLKDTSVAFLIQYNDFFSQIQEVASTNFEFFKAYVTAGLVYLALVSVIVVMSRRLEKRIALPGF